MGDSLRVFWTKLGFSWTFSCLALSIVRLTRRELIMENVSLALLLLLVLTAELWALELSFCCLGLRAGLSLKGSFSFVSSSNPIHSAVGSAFDDSTLCLCDEVTWEPDKLTLFS